MQKWEYLFVTFEGRSDASRPWRINGEVVEDWLSGPTMHEFANQMGEQGWELVGSSWGRVFGWGDAPFLYMDFKRPRE